MRSTPEKFVFYDGDCGFCNRSVRFILKHEKDSTLHFASIQSDFTRHFFQEKGFPVPSLDTLYFFDGSRLLIKSEAILQLSKHLKFPWSALYLFRWIPVPIRDAVYVFIARNRKKLGSGNCFVPTAEQRKRFPDLNGEGKQSL